MVVVRWSVWERIVKALGGGVTMMEPEDIAIMIAGDDRIRAPAPLGLVEATLRLPNSMAPIALVS